MMKVLFFFVALLLASASYAQEPSKFLVGGYIKYMQTLGIQSWDNIEVDNLLHHRLNLSYFPSDNVTLKAALRNRLIYGDSPKRYHSLGLSYASLIDEPADDFFPLSRVLVEREPFLLHTVIDRLNVDFAWKDWQITVGRQRINWGVNLAWNPNDLFNAYSFFDFDYEERPGSDAVRVQYFPSYTSSLEFAVKAADSVDEAVAALLWRTNKWSYDFQLLSGYFKQDFVLGGAWAGQLKNAGFKGEWSLFTPLNSDSTRQTKCTAALSVDHMFQNSLFLSGSVLYNSDAGDASLFSLFVTEISARNVFPFEYSMLVLAQYPVRDRLNVSFSSIYSPGNLDLLFINPGLSFSIRDNWDLDFIAQLAWARVITYDDLAKNFYLRLKWSY